MGSSDEKLYEESESEYSDDSQEDPNFDAVEETRLTFSSLSLKRKTKTSVVKGVDGKCEDPSDIIEMPIPELNGDDQEIYENIQKIIEGGQVERLKVDQCKIYLRKHGLRLSGNKETLILRIKEHIDVVNGGGERKYPASSFVFDCKGDACMGDIVMFEQNVYEEFSIASRSAKGPPCGTRVVAGRIVKESYGAAKQQHTFTIEVLWSKGEKPLGPLHQLLIKGRNLYRLKTMRRRWEDEGERQRMLSEKHARGGVARSNREARIKQKETRKAHNKPPTRAQHSNAKQVAKAEPSLHPATDKLTSQPKRPDQKNIHERKTHPHDAYTGTCQPKRTNGNPKTVFEGVLGKQPLNSITNCGGFAGPASLLQPVMHVVPSRYNYWNMYGGQSRTDYFTATSPVRVHQHQHQHQRYFGNSYHVPSKENRQVGYERKQACRYYAQGRCNFGDRCKFSHELA